jgi:hypothetical protein
MNWAWLSTAGRGLSVRHDATGSFQLDLSSGSVRSCLSAWGSWLAVVLG